MMYEQNNVNLHDYREPGSDDTVNPECPPNCTCNTMIMLSCVAASPTPVRIGRFICPCSRQPTIPVSAGRVAGHQRREEDLNLLVYTKPH
jgi:hypothetical protein